LEAKGKEDGVVTLPSGLMYKEIRAGNGTFVKKNDNILIQCLRA